MSLNLAHALRLTSPTSVAFSGAGGKTTAIFTLARELSQPAKDQDEGSEFPKNNVVVTTTTHFGAWQAKYADEHIIGVNPEKFEDFTRESNRVILFSGPLEGDKLTGLDAVALSRLADYCRTHSLFLLIEADGSRQKPLKAPAEHEPDIPEFVNHVVYCVGLNALGKPLREEFVHRPDLFSALTGLPVNHEITSRVLTQYLIYPKGGLKNIPTGAKRIALLNQAQNPELIGAAKSISQQILGVYQSVIIAQLGKLEDHVSESASEEQVSVSSIHIVDEKIAGIVLAAGESKRFGQTKQILTWKGESFVRAVAKTALEAGLSPVLVVTGADHLPVEDSIRDLPVKVIFNNEWSKGQSSSIKTGVRFLENRDSEARGNSKGIPPQSCGGAIFLLVDQPQIPAAIIRSLIEVHSSSLAPIVAPLVLEERRGNPVFFDRITFQDLLTLDGDIGGRALFSQYHVNYLPWHDESVLVDVDKPEDYIRLVGRDEVGDGS